MARTRTLSQLREEAYRRADCEGAYDRHVQADVDRDINQGASAFWDEMIAVCGGDFLQTTGSITTTASTSSYSLDALSPRFYMLLAVRLNETGGYPLRKFNTHEEAALREADSSNGRPTHYQLRRTGAGALSLVVLPEHSAGLTLSLNYVPGWVDLVDDDDTFDGVNGWEEYIVAYAAQKMAKRDGESELVAECEADMTKALSRIKRVIPKRDSHEARRVRDVRGPSTVRRRYPPA